MPELSLASGAVRGWDRRNQYYFSLLKSLAKHYDFDLDTPYKDLPKAIQEIILYGSDEEEISFPIPMNEVKLVDASIPLKG